MFASCPSRGEIVACCVGRYTSICPEKAESVFAHLASCASCRAIADSTEQYDDPLIFRLRQQAGQPVTPPDPELPQLLARVKSAATTISAPAEMVGEYLILSKLGEGGMGIVYKAKHPRLDRLVAVKVIKPECATRFPGAMARFAREIETMTRIDHPHMVRIFDCDMKAREPYFVMEYLEGATLRAIVDQWGPLNVAEAIELTRQAAQGLQALHTAGRVHRDIKPANLMLTDAGLKILDMGLVGFDGMDKKNALTSGLHVMGTRDYMAPEQSATPNAVGTRADIYSLGVTLFCLLTGETPASRSVLEDPSGPLSHIPKELKMTIQKMLARRPEDRHVNAAAVDAELQEFGRGANLRQLLASPARRGPDSSTVLASKPRRRMVRWGGYCLLLAVVACLAAVFVAGFFPSQQRPREDPDAKKGAWAQMEDGPVGEIANIGGGGPNQPTAVRISPRRLEAVSAEGFGMSFAGPLRVWDLDKRKLSTTLKPHSSDIRYAPDGLFATRARDGIQFLGTASPTPTYTIKTDACVDYSISADGKLLLVAGNTTGFVRLHQIPSGKVAQEYKVAASAGTACFTWDQKYILTGGSDNAVRLFSLEKDRQEKTYEGHDAAIWLVRPLADGERFLSICNSGKAIVWNLKEGTQLQKFALDPCYMGLYHTAAVAPEAARLAVGHHDGTITIWDLNKGAKTTTLAGHKNSRVTAIDITPDGRYAVSGGIDVKIRFWRLPPPIAPVGELKKAIKDK